MLKTFYISDLSLLKHRCEWDSTHIEIPERLEKISEKLEDCGLLDQCERLEPRFAKEDEILAVHSKEYFNKIKNSKGLNLDELEDLSSQFEDMYLNEFSFDAAMKSAGCALELTEKVLNNPGSNGFAVIRPPGHHAAPNEGCGFCVFNNIAICAKKARSMGLEKVLIIDWDVHAGQGTQYCIEDDSNIYLVSMHRYESGHFWPNLPESNIENDYKQTLNVPLQRTGLGDAEYATFIDLLVRPIISDFQPELILVSCGYDAAFGDREGEMKVTPAGYGHLVGTLASLEIPLVVLLEGGYFLDAIPEDAFHTVKALIEREPTKLPLGFPSLGTVDEIFMKNLLTIMSKVQERFPTLKLLLEQFEHLTGNAVPIQEIQYTGERDFSLPFPTRGVYGDFPELNRFQETFHKQLLPQYLNPPKREILEISSNDKTVFIKCNGNIVVSFTPNSRKSIRKHEVSFIFYFIYLPLSWQFELNWRKLMDEILKSHGEKESKLELPKCLNLLNSILLRF
uniref:Histone deacetylase domain-containing protein n=1 Tax=Panagrolaimus sp. PS1159 TaxID=55785 RepID=A0AC35FS61_9BILA